MKSNNDQQHVYSLYKSNVSVNCKQIQIVPITNLDYFIYMKWMITVYACIRVYIYNIQCAGFILTMMHGMYMLKTVYVDCKYIIQNL